MPGTPNYPRGIGDEVTDMRREMRAGRTQAQSRIGFDQVTKGSLTIVDDNGNEIVKFGNLGVTGGETVYGMSVHRADGTEAFRMWSSASGANTFVAPLMDRSGNIVVSDDDVSGQGIATPHIPMGLLGVSANAAVAAAFWPRTTSATMATLLEAFLPALQPRMRCIVYGLSNDVATTGQLDVLVNGTSILGSPVTIPANGFSNPTGGPYALPGWPGSINYGDEIHVEIQCRRTAGTGNIYVQCLGLYGYQS